jgi:hypothetical protein
MPQIELRPADRADGGFRKTSMTAAGAAGR